MATFLLAHVSSIDEERRPRHPGRFVRGKVDRRPGGIFRRADATQRMQLLGEHIVTNSRRIDLVWVGHQLRELFLALGIRYPRGAMELTRILFLEGVVAKSILTGHHQSQRVASSTKWPLAKAGHWCVLGVPTVSPELQGVPGYQLGTAEVADSLAC